MVNSGKVTYQLDDARCHQLAHRVRPSAAWINLLGPTIEPNSAEIAETTRPVTMSAVQTGPNSRTKRQGDE